MSARGLHSRALCVGRPRDSIAFPACLLVYSFFPVFRFNKLYCKFYSRSKAARQARQAGEVNGSKRNLSANWRMMVDRKKDGKTF